MSVQQYANLDPTQTSVIGFEMIDTAIFPTLAPAKQAVLRIVNMIAPPAYNATTQYVFQQGWTISAADVQPIWVIAALPATTVTWNQMLALNLVTAYNNYIATAVPSQAATNALVRQLAQAMTAILQHQYGDLT